MDDPAAMSLAELRDRYDGFAQHKGYGTREHAQAIVRLGLTPIHRRSFEPVRRLGVR